MANKSKINIKFLDPERLDRIFGGKSKFITLETSKEYFKNTRGTFIFSNTYLGLSNIAKQIFLGVEAIKQLQIYSDIKKHLKFSGFIININFDSSENNKLETILNKFGEYRTKNIVDSENNKIVYLDNIYWDEDNQRIKGIMNYEYEAPYGGFFEFKISQPNFYISKIKNMEDYFLITIIVSIPFDYRKVRSAFKIILEEFFPGNYEIIDIDLAQFKQTKFRHEILRRFIELPLNYPLHGLIEFKTVRAKDIDIDDIEDWDDSIKRGKYEIKLKPFKFIKENLERRGAILNSMNVIFSSKEGNLLFFIEYKYDFEKPNYNINVILRNIKELNIDKEYISDLVIDQLRTIKIDDKEKEEILSTFWESIVIIYLREWLKED